MPVRKRPIEIRAYTDGDLARLMKAAIETMYPKARTGFQAHVGFGLWIVATDAKVPEVQAAARQAWDIHCKEQAEKEAKNEAKLEAFAAVHPDPLREQGT